MHDKSSIDVRISVPDNKSSMDVEFLCVATVCDNKSSIDVEFLCVITSRVQM